MGQSKPQVLRSDPVHKREVPLRGYSYKGMAKGGDVRRSEVYSNSSGQGDRHPSGAQEGEQMESETAYCANCVLLIHLEGVLRCSEFKFLLSAQDIQNPIECDKYTPLSDLKNMKRFQGRAHKRKVVDELVLGAVIQQATIRRRCVALSEIQDALQGRMHRTGIHDVLVRLEVESKVVKSKFVFRHPAAKWRKRWVVNGYWPTLLPSENNRQTN